MTARAGVDGQWVNTSNHYLYQALPIARQPQIGDKHTLLAQQCVHNHAVALQIAPIRIPP